MLAEPGFTATAQRLGRSLASEGGVPRAVALVVAAAEAQRGGAGGEGPRLLGHLQAPAAVADLKEHGAVESESTLQP